MEPFLEKGGNVTNDFFTSLKLAKNLKQKEMSFEATIKELRKEQQLSVRTLQNSRYSSPL